MNQPADVETNRLFFEAIALRKCVEATYNRGLVRLAPHILYTRHGELYVDAVTIARDGQPPREVKLGSFKLSGLKQPALTETGFEPVAIFDSGETRYQGVTLFAV